VPNRCLNEIILSVVASELDDLVGDLLRLFVAHAKDGVSGADQRKRDPPHQQRVAVSRPSQTPARVPITVNVSPAPIVNVQVASFGTVAPRVRTNSPST
jgi:hypothetical protein